MNLFVSLLCLTLELALSYILVCWKVDCSGLFVCCSNFEWSTLARPCNRRCNTLHYP